MKLFSSPFSLLLIMTLSLAVYWTAYGVAWYWSKLRGWELTPELIEFSVAITTFYAVLDFLIDNLRCYADSKTADIGDTEKKELKRGDIIIPRFILLILLVIIIGWGTLHLVRL